MSKRNFATHGASYTFPIHDQNDWKPYPALTYRAQMREYENRPFPSSLVPLFQNESKCETFHMKMSFACNFFFMQIKVIFIRIVSHLDSLWNRGTRELGNGLIGRASNFHNILIGSNYDWKLIPQHLQITKYE